MIFLRKTHLILTEPSLCLGAGTVCSRFSDSVHEDAVTVDCEAASEGK